MDTPVSSPTPVSSRTLASSPTICDVCDSAKRIYHKSVYRTPRLESTLIAQRFFTQPTSSPIITPQAMRFDFTRFEWEFPDF